MTTVLVIIAIASNIGCAVLLALAIREKARQRRENATGALRASRARARVPARHTESGTP